MKPPNIHFGLLERTAPEKARASADAAHVALAQDDGVGGVQVEREPRGVRHARVERRGVPRRVRVRRPGHDQAAAARQRGKPVVQPRHVKAQRDGQPFEDWLSAPVHQDDGGAQRRRLDYSALHERLGDDNGHHVRRAGQSRHRQQLASTWKQRGS